MLGIYKSLMQAAEPALRALLEHRCRKNKEDAARLAERTGKPGRPRPDGALVWLHAASVGEAQSALILVNAILRKAPQAHVLVTTGTVTSARLMAERLPARAFHQFYPLDHPGWVKNFVDHWRPDLVFWVESEIWPNMLFEIQGRGTPALLVNARLSPRSARRWRWAGANMRAILNTFSLIMAQTDKDVAAFRTLGAQNVVLGGNLKYAAEPLPCNQEQLDSLQDSTAGRTIWLYASTHEGEEALAARLHLNMKKDFPGLLTIIIPRHPERGGSVRAVCETAGLKTVLRSENKMPQDGDDVYIADTLGELGLFYRLSPIACIGRSFSSDGGGGHNPIEAAQLDCAVLHGPRVQNLADIYHDMGRGGAALRLESEMAFEEALRRLLSDENALRYARGKAKEFACERTGAADRTLAMIEPWLEKLSQEEKSRACG